MSAGTPSLCSTLLFFSVFMFVSADQKIITADIGDSVILPCRVTNKITAVKWIKHYLGEKIVFLYQDNKVDSDNQNSFYKNRVDLQDRHMKDGDVSIILKDVAIYDNETYHCHVKVAGTNSWKYISYIYLYVVPPGQSGGLGGSIGLIVGVVVAVMVVSLCLSFCFCTALRNIVTR